MPKSLVEDLAWSLVVLAGETGLGAVTLRALARHTRVSPGTLTHHFASKRELWALCTVVVGRWLADATDDHVADRGAVGLFPEPGDATYRCLVSAWVQLRAHALTDPEVDARVQDLTTVLRRRARRALVDGAPDISSTAWWYVEALRQEVIRPGSELTPGRALAAIQRLIPEASREPRVHG
jgi:AcrR family transcriptional regulator